MNDWQLLSRYRKGRSEASFTMLVERHLSLVHAVCKRDLGDSDLADDATQVVFIILGRKAHTLLPTGSLSSWLFETARLAARDLRKQETRRKVREERMRQQMETAPTNTDAWSDIEPALNDALAKLSSGERSVILMRFFEEQTFKEIAEALGISVAAAEKRGLRALERLRAMLGARGIVVATTVLIAGLTEKSADASPLLSSHAVSALARGGTLTPSLALTTEGVLRTMYWTRIKTIAVATAIVAATGFAGNAAVHTIVGSGSGTRVVVGSNHGSDQVHLYAEDTGDQGGDVLIDPVRCSVKNGQARIFFQESLSRDTTIWQGASTDIPTRILHTRLFLVSNVTKTKTRWGVQDEGRVHIQEFDDYGHQTASYDNIARFAECSNVRHEIVIDAGT